MKIQIYDQTYSFSADQDEEYLKEIGRLRGRQNAHRRAKSTRTVDSLKVAVLAAMNIADEMFTLRERQQEIDGPLRKRVEKCVALVEKALEHSN